MTLDFPKEQRSSCAISAEDQAFLDLFEQCTLQKTCWTHEAHIRFAWLRMEQCKTFDEALDKIRIGIQAYNSSVQSVGYHETITVAFARLIHAKRQKTRAATWQEFLHENEDLLLKRCLLEFYSKEILAGKEARSAFVEPDKKPLPT
jgi:hypothetical protein